MTTPLTDRQQKVLAFIEKYRREYGISPSVRDIGAHFGFTSPNSVRNHLNALIKKGAIEVYANVGRGIVLKGRSVKVKCPHCGEKFEHQTT